MTKHAAGSRKRQRPRGATVAAVLGVAIALGALGYATVVSVPSLASSARSESGLTDTGGLSAADGVIPGTVSIFNETYAGITHLKPDMLASLRKAAKAAGDEGIEIDVTSGWRSKAYQQKLFNQGIKEYGSEQAAAQWVARPGTSIHEAGDAVDVSGSGAQAWLVQNGRLYGLCQMYANEPWHFEWRPAAIESGCPEIYTNPGQDPRLAQ
ncbi:hypothetical protein Back2_27480 [Nocardioides baekrokdamisoli]|uniref:D-alanyl-D-alanine carboxypeptidase-like core domain-containing protein n=1 Tax=Nocardioides baekrokdamisoli TaxID=1804624 RepID=A0A3G9IXP2_9ACTN|nr:M15 family metallopeptidase [Nocardioides baekrokdamisoli]BBH18461.1 hypothetical protein Back2_27480 [Nocardioides baekrokdamisoli]